MGGTRGDDNNDKSALDELHRRIEEIERDGRLVSLDEIVELFRLKETAENDIGMQAAEWVFMFHSLKEIESSERLQRALPGLFHKKVFDMEDDFEDGWFSCEEAGWGT